MSIPTKDSLLVPYSANFATRINASPATFGLNETQTETFSLRQSAFVTAYNAMMSARADGTRSESLTAVKNAAKAALVTIARELYGLVQSNTSVTDANKILLGVKVRSGSVTPVPPPTVQPGMALVSVVGHKVTVSVFDSAAVPKVRRPSGVKGSFVYSYVGASYPSDPTTWQFHGLFPRNRVEVDFPDSTPAGSQVWICATWVGTRGETGPVSVPITTYLQYSGTAGGEPGLKIAA